MDEIVKKYSNSDINVYWKPARCDHSTKCWKSLVKVFNPANRPWINMQGASTDEIVNQVNLCPTGALTWDKNTEPEPPKTVESESTPKQ